MKGKQSAGRCPERSPGGNRGEDRKESPQKIGQSMLEEGREWQGPSGQLDEGPPEAPAEPRMDGAALAGALAHAPG